ncbi:hypothetical protein [Aeromicrobium sp. NPDC092404]|uniref:hypothetical protein n=1 Tax=Aeromicrobium sp. NPDC092404 TaxID=3154976 RepID=UPI003420D1A5
MATALAEGEMTDRPAPEGVRRVRRPGWQVVVVLTLAVGLTIYGVVGVLDLREHRARDVQRDDAVRTANRAVLLLVSITKDNADRNLDDLLELTETGTGFRENLAQLAKTFQQTVEAGKVTSTGEVTSAGLVRMTDTSARVVVAASAVVVNVDAPDGEPRNYRMSVSLKRVDGTWKISNMEFVA